MSNLIDLSGKNFGRLVVFEYVHNPNWPQGKWKCKCSCGKTTFVNSGALRRGDTKSCGCLRAELSAKRNSLDLIGKRFGRLLVIDKTSKRNSRGVIIWECLCDCETLTYVTTNGLTTGHTRSCGCLLNEMRAVANRGENSHMWKGGVWAENLEVRQGEPHRQWSVKVRKRDKNICQICGSSRQLVAHHLDGFDNFIEQRFDTNNGITLCANCHDNFHNEYGRGGNTTQQFQEWVTRHNLTISPFCGIISESKSGTYSVHVHLQQI